MDNVDKLNNLLRLKGWDVREGMMGRNSAVANTDGKEYWITWGDGREQKYFKSFKDCYNWINLSSSHSSGLLSGYRLR